MLPQPARPEIRMSRPLLAASLLALALAACQGQAAPTPPGAADGTDAVAARGHDRAFSAIAARFLDEGLALSPVSATQIGDHRFDAGLADRGEAGRRKPAGWPRGMLAELAALEPPALSRDNQVDALILRNPLEGSLWDLEP